MITQNLKLKMQNYNSKFKKFFNFALLFFIFNFSFLINSCSSLFGNGSEGEGASSINDIAISNEIISFESSGGQTDYHTVSFKNLSDSPITVTNIIFYHNLCSAFSLYSITDQTGQMLLDGSEPINFTVGAGATVYLHLAYCPPECIYSDYDTTLFIYYEDNSGNQVTYVTLQSSPAGGVCRDVLVCEEDPFAFEYKPEVFGQGLPETGDYYFRINKMHAYLYPVSAPENIKVIGTDINIDPDMFQSPYLKVSLDDVQGNGTLYQIEECSQFIIPAPEDDPYFAGADTQLTTKDNTFFVLDEDGNLEVDELVITLLTENIDSSELGSPSPLPDDNGTFQISLKVTLTTDATPEDQYLGSLLDSSDYYDGIMNLIDSDDDGQYQLQGTALSGDDATITLVARGEFTNEDDDFIGEETVGTILLEDEAYIYVQIEATLVTRVGSLED